MARVRVRIRPRVRGCAWYSGVQSLLPWVRLRFNGRVRGKKPAYLKTCD